MAKVTNKKIKEWFKENYEHVVEYDGIRIETDVDKHKRESKHLKWQNNWPISGQCHRFR